MAADTLKSAAITNWEATPYVEVEAGAGAKAEPFVIEGFCSVTAVGIATSTSTYQLVRIPTWARIKKVFIWSDVAIDSNTTQQLALDFNMSFSTSTHDGTPAIYQGLVPTTVGTPDGVTAGTTTTWSSYTTPNKLFGTVTYSGNNAKIAMTDITLNGSANYTFDKFIGVNLWKVFGFQNGQGQLADPGGFFDLTAYVSTAAATGHAGRLAAQVWFTN